MHPSTLERQRERAGKVSRSPVCDLTAVVSLANQKARNAIVGAENLLSVIIVSGVSKKYCK